MTNKKQFVSELSHTAIAYLVVHQYNRIKDDATPQEVFNISTDLMAEKLDNLQELITPELREYLESVKEDEPLFGQLYTISDFYDDEEPFIATLDEARQYLVDFWNFNPDDDMTDEEHEQMIRDILMSGPLDMMDRLAAVGKIMDEVK